MSKLKEIFNRMQEAKKEQRGIRAMYRDALLGSQEYEKIVQDLEDLKIKKKQIEIGVQRDFNADFKKLEELKLDLETDKELISDIALNQYVKGESIEIVDEYDNKYEPIFSVKFKKTF
ncbi:MAG: hypothetical protein HQ536_00570 [Parcubacteria group bacterium]|nr:hypothetical protein [Parcubacteria group bacterium]